MNNQPIIFDLKYTPYRLPKNASEYELSQHRAERAFYNMSGEDNILKYITTEGKRAGNFTMLEYLEKNTGVFNQDGMISEDEVDEMKERAKNNKGIIWHGFISFNEHDSKKIDEPEKCIRLVKNVFPSFLREAGFNPDNIDLMCALHLDRPHHLHIHFVFWEKEPRIREMDGTFSYRKKGKINEDAIDNTFVRLGLFADDRKDELYSARDDALKSLRATTAIKKVFTARDDVKKEIVSLAKDLPLTGRLSYGSKDMEAYRERVDKIVEMMLEIDDTARKADMRFYKALNERRRKISNVCGNDYLTADSDMPVYHHKIDESKIKITEKIEEDYKRRQGNIILNLCKFIKPEYFERKQGKRYKTNDNKLKRRISISKRNVERRLDRFFLTFGKDCEILERDFSHRLQDIEEEKERERKEETQNTTKEVNYKD